jgi:hypothetical protein
MPSLGVRPRNDEVRLGNLGHCTNQDLETLVGTKNPDEENHALLVMAPHLLHLRALAVSQGQRLDVYSIRDDTTLIAVAG